LSDCKFRRITLMLFGVAGIGLLGRTAPDPPARDRLLAGRKLLATGPRRRDD
jgi:hypothetical protein